MILNVQSKKVEPDIAVLEMTGRITMGSDSQQIEWELAELLKENHKKVIFDLTEVTFLDSTGIGILVMCHAKLKKAGGALRIAGARGMVEAMLDLTSVNKIVSFYPTAAEAAQGFQVKSCVEGSQRS
jgi:anti-sigma B factor antagonist